MTKATLIFIALALIVPKCYSTEQKWDEHAEFRVNGGLSKEDFIQLQSDLTNQFSLEGQNLSQPCTSKMQKLITSEIAQIFPMLDAIGKPGSGIFQGNFFWLGAFSECEQMKKYKYCIAGFRLKAEFFYKTAVNQDGVLGTCMPQECNKRDIRLILNKIPLSLNKLPYVKATITFPNHSTILATYGNTVFCEERDESYSDGAITMLVICALILLMCFIGTVSELFIDWIESPLACINHINAVKRAPSSDDLEQLVPSAPLKTSIKDNFFLKVVMCFSLVKNTKAVMNTDAPDRAILSINGIRTISMMWVILGHCYALGEGMGGLENVTVLLQVLKRFTFLSVDNAFFSVDSFFLLSGLLVSYLGIKRLESKGKLPLWKFYLHRYIRLTPSYAFVIVFAMYLLPLMGKGPMWSTVAKNMFFTNCKDYWWTNILYISNFYPTKMEKECIGWGWYLANDMQFYIISPIILYAMYKLRLLGALISNGVALFSSVIITGVLMGYYKLHALQVVADISTRPKEKASFEDLVYVKPYCRIQPYLVGMVLGYFLFKKYQFRGSAKWLFYLLGWAIAIVLGLTVVYGTWGTSKPDGHQFTEVENIVYGSLSRLTWALAVAWVIFACQNGFGGLVQSFLSWRAFMPLSRLTYGAYLIHPMTLSLFFQTKLSTRGYTDLDLAFQFVSITVMSYAAAFVLAITVEYPILNIDKLLFS